jgi:hypothetical protein
MLVVLIAIVAGVILVDPASPGGTRFSVTEQAHRLVFGYGLVPWEFQLGMRSWLLPKRRRWKRQPARRRPRLLPSGDRGELAPLASAPVICCFLWRAAGRARRRFAGAAIVAIALSSLISAPAPSAKRSPRICW